MRVRWLALLAAMALVGGSCRDGGPDEPDDAGSGKVQVTVSFQGALTGDFRSLVIHSFQAAQLRVDELNADEGFPAVVTLERADTEGDRLKAPSVAERVAADPETVAVIGPAFSGESEVTGDTYEAAGIPFVTPSAIDPALADHGWEYWYRSVATEEDQGVPLGQWMASRHASIFVAHDESDYGQALAEAVAEAAGQSGASIEKVEGIVPTEVYSELIGDVEASGADALFYGGYDVQTGLIVAQARDAGLDVPIYSGDGSVSTTLLDLAGETASDIFLSCPCNLEGDEGFRSRYESAYGETRVPLFAAEGYDAASLIGEGIRSAIEGGAEDPAAIRAGIKTYLDSLTEDAPFHGVAKAIAFEDSHELAAPDRRALIFLYEVEPGRISLEGSAAELPR
jgi:branched-chain amino acid transport system substrate-binding protein